MTAEREAMTLAELRAEVAITSHESLNSMLRDRWLRALDAHLSRAAEPVYQVHGLGDNTAWTDVTDFKGIENTKYSKRILYTHPPEPARDAKDSARLDALEADIAKYGPITLHNGEGIKACQRGLGMANTGRTLRDAIDGMTGSDAAMAQESGE